MDLAKIQFQNQDGARKQRLHVIAALLDAQGSFVTGKEVLLEFALKPETYERAVNNGFNAVLNLEAAPGTYRLRTVVVEGEDNGRYSTATQPAQIQ
jgi:hypothetical protein